METLDENRHPIVLHFALGIVLLSVWMIAHLSDNFSLHLTGAVFLPLYAAWMARKLGAACWRALWIAAPFTIPDYTFHADYNFYFGFGLGSGLFALMALIMLAARRHFDGASLMSDHEPSVASTALSAALLAAAALTVRISLDGDNVSFGLGYQPFEAIPVVTFALILWSKARAATVTVILIALALLVSLLPAILPDARFVGVEGDIEVGYDYLFWKVGFGATIPWACGLGIATAWGAQFVLSSFDRPQNPSRFAPIALLLLALIALPALTKHASIYLSEGIASSVEVEAQQAEEEDLSYGETEDPGYADDGTIPDEDYVDYGLVDPDPVQQEQVVVTGSRIAESFPDLIVTPFWLILLGALAYGIGRRAPNAGPAWLPAGTAVLVTLLWLAMHGLSGQSPAYFLEYSMESRMSPLLAIILTTWVGVWLGANHHRRIAAEETTI